MRAVFVVADPRGGAAARSRQRSARRPTTGIAAGPRSTPQPVHPTRIATLMSDVRIHHLNCGTMCPRGQRLINGHGRLLGSAELVCYVLLIAGPDGLHLI